MERSMLVLFVSMLLFTGCLVEPRRGGVEVVPALPEVVEIGPDGYYGHRGYHYFYDHDRWSYSDRRDGARRELPRSRWPRETRHRGFQP